MAATVSWLPDIVASWYDAFHDERYLPEVDDWRAVRPRFVGQWQWELLHNPHEFAKDLDGRIASADDTHRSELRYRALQAASDAIRDAGVVHVHNHGSDGWDDIRRHWRAKGTLTWDAPGVLLPRRERRCAWQPPRAIAKEYRPGSHFEAFLRWKDSKSLDLDELRVRVLPELHTPVESIEKALTVGVAPLVGDIADFIFEKLDPPSGWSGFRVSLKRPSEVEAACLHAIEKAAEAGCDVLVLPELCLSPEIQGVVQSTVRSITRRFGRPWLVVAGSAHTPLAGTPTRFHNRAVVCDVTGTEWLQHNKLYRYEMSAREQDRYGIVDALGEISRTEDIVMVPRILEVLETPIGRVAVLICEDLAVPSFAHALLEALEIDWLLVPVMDGIQVAQRWTGVRARDYAAEQGTSVLVATCAALVTAHRDFERRNGRRDPGQQVGLLVMAPGKEVLPLTQVGDARDPILWRIDHK